MTSRRPVVVDDGVQQVLKGQFHCDLEQEAGHGLLVHVIAVLKVDVFTGELPLQSQGELLIEPQEAFADETGEGGRGEAFGGDLWQVRAAGENLLEFLLDRVKNLFSVRFRAL